MSIRTSLYTSCISGECHRVFDHVRPKRDGEKIFDTFLSGESADPVGIKNALASLSDGRSTTSVSSSLPSKKRV